MRFAIDEFLLMFSAMQAVLFAAFLAAGPGRRRRSNQLLVALLLCVALSLGEPLVFIVGLAERHTHLAFVGNLFGLLVPPLLLLHARSLMYSDLRLRRRDALHLVPFAAITGVAVLGYHAQPAEVRRAILLGTAEGLVGSPWVGAAVHAVVLGYLAATLVALSRFAAAVREVYSNLEHKTLAWLRVLLASVMAVWVLDVVTAFLPNEASLLPGLPLARALASFAFINLFLFHAVRQPELFAGLEREAADRLASPPPPRFAPEEERAYADRLDRLVREQAPHLDAELTIDDLAGRVGLTARDLSALLNGALGRSFYDFVNGHRIEHAKRLLLEDSAGRSVLEVMYASGFNSKSAFYEAFRRQAGTTPADFRRRARPSAIP